MPKTYVGCIQSSCVWALLTVIGYAIAVPEERIETGGHTMGEEVFTGVNIALLMVLMLHPS